MKSSSKIASIFTTVLILLALCVLPGDVSATTTTQSFGAIRWDAWNGKAYDIISETVSQVMRPPAYHWRLPWYANIDNHTGNVTFDANRQSVMDQELQMAADAGIKFFAYDTYCIWPTDNNHQLCRQWWDAESVGYKATDPAYGLDLHLRSTKKSLVNISLVLLGASPASPEMRPRYLKLLKDSSFHRVHGDRPLIFLFNAGPQEARLVGSWEAWKSQWGAFRNESLAQGTGNPYLVAQTVGTANFGQALTLKEKLGFDAVGAYALPGGTTQGTPFQDQRDAAGDFWERAKEAKVDLIPPVPTGWDPRPRAAHPPVWVHEGPEHYIAPTPIELTGLFKDTRSFMAQNPTVVPTQTALVYAWNECTEGGWLLPTKGEGYARLEAVANATQG